MAKPVCTVSDSGTQARIVRFEIPGGVCSPAEFAEAVAEIAAKLPGSRVVYLFGRGPVWGYGMLVHAAHPSPAIAVFDPRLGDGGAYVVVATHTEAYANGQILPNPEPIL